MTPQAKSQIIKLDQTLLKEFLSYNQDSGLFTWNVFKPQIKPGDIAGHLTNAGYIAISINRKSYLAHRLAFLYMDGEFPDKEVDHVNGIRDDNRWCNLRKVSRSDNMRNQRKYSNNTSGVTGVSWNKECKKWHSFICVNKKIIPLGMFSDIKIAIKARKDAELQYGFHKNHGK